MSYEILGPLTVRASSGVLPLKGLRHRRILAALLLEPDGTVSVSRLIDTLWEDRPPSTAREQVQNCVGSLRHILSNWRVPGAISTQAAGYRLDVDNDLVDARRFEKHRGEAHTQLNAGDTNAATQSLRHALDLWHGDALEDVLTESLEGAAARLNELRVRTVEEYVELLMRRGKAEAAVAELRTWTHAQPYNEQLHGQLMLALYATGRTVEARQILRELRRRLQTELGVEPDLDELERASSSPLDREAVAKLVHSAAAQLRTALTLLTDIAAERS